MRKNIVKYVFIAGTGICIAFFAGSKVGLLQDCNSNIKTVLASEVVNELNNDINYMPEHAKYDKSISEPIIESLAESLTEQTGIINEPLTQQKNEPQFINFSRYKVQVQPNIKKHDYDLSSLVRNDVFLSYDRDSRYDYEIGIDVSHHNGNINWEKVKASGIKFAMIRVGYRGYGGDGTLNRDRCFEQYIRGAQRVGLKVGVYFFSQAISDQEAADEANFVLNILGGRQLDLPVVYDPESISNDVARTDNVSKEQFTRNTEIFCRMIKDAGYQPMIYSNMYWQAFKLDLSKLSEYPVWYADYSVTPRTPYKFEYWQYTDKGVIDGIPSRVDMNIRFLEKNFGENQSEAQDNSL